MSDDRELVFINAADVEAEAHGSDGDWGDWRREGLSLVYPAYPGGGAYPIDLERFTDSAHVLDTIMQIAGKTWATNDCIAGLVRALDSLLYPQSTLCSGGRNKTLTPAQIGGA